MVRPLSAIVRLRDDLEWRAQHLVPGMTKTELAWAVAMPSMVLAIGLVPLLRLPQHILPAVYLTAATSLIGWAVVMGGLVMRSWRWRTLGSLFQASGFLVAVIWAIAVRVFS